MRNKKLLILFCFIISVISWKPTFIGHRGCYIGLENSVDSYRNGVEIYGYDGLECDCRVTKDGEYVSNHDGVINGDKGKMTVEKTTLAVLKTNHLTQKRGGKTYQGYICTMDEYLSICEEKHVIPMIELKWTTGINPNDMSKFDGLYQLVKKHNLTHRAIFLTSMRKSIEFIRTHYKEAKAQYLINDLTDDKYNWAKQWKVNVSFAADHMTANAVDRLHKIHLYSACWCINDSSWYQKVVKWGSYMLTCDYLKPKEQKEMEKKWPDLPDKPENNRRPLENWEIEEAQRMMKEEIADIEDYEKREKEGSQFLNLEA